MFFLRTIVVFVYYSVWCSVDPQRTLRGNRCAPEKIRINQCIPKYRRIIARINLLAIVGANFPIFLFPAQFGQKVDVLLGELGPATCCLGIEKKFSCQCFFANLDWTLVSDLWKGLKFGEELSQLSWGKGQISFQRKSGVFYLSRFGSREVVGETTQEGVEVMDPVVEGEEGMKPVKPKLSPATFFLFFFLWFNFMCTSKFLTCGYIFNDLETTFGNQQIVILNTYPHITEGALLFSHSRLISIRPLLAWNKKLVWK